MKQRYGKLRTKLIGIFVMLVGGPLLLTGVVLSMAGRNNVVRTGDSLNEISQQSVKEVAGKMSRTVTDNLHRAGKQLAQIGTTQLAELGEEQSRQSTEALREAGKGLLSTGDLLLKQSNADMIAASGDVVRRAGGRLRAMHQEKIERVSGAMIVQSKDEFTKTGKELAQTTKVEIEELSEDLNEQRAKGVSGVVELFFVKDVNEFWDSARKALMTVEDEAEASRVLRDLRISHRFVVFSALYSQEGKLLASPVEEVGARAARWKPLVDQCLQTRTAQNSGLVVVAPGGTIGLAVATPLSAEGGDLRAIVVADISLVRIQSAVDVFKATSTTVSVSDASGVLIAHSDASLRGKEVPGEERQILNEIEKIEQTPDATRTRNTLRFGPEDERQMCAYVASVKPYGWTVLVRQPLKKVLETTTRLETAMVKRADVAAERMEREATRLASQAVNEVRPQQETIAQEADSSVRAANRRALDQALKRLYAEQGALTSRAVSMTQAAASASALTAERTMKQEAERAVAASVAQMQERAQSAVDEGLSRMRKRTSESAGDAVRDMRQQSVLLLAVFLAFAVVVAAVTASSIVRPVATLAEGAVAIAHGDYSKRVDVRSGDEMGQLAESFNSMAAAIERSNEVISREKSRLQAIVESTPDGLLIEDDGGGLTMLNAATTALLMLPAELPLNQAVVRAELETATRERLDLCVAAAQSEVGGAQDFVVENGHRHVLQVRAVSVNDEQGRAHGRLIHLHDVTHEREMDQMKTDFVSMVSHELRTPLTSILGFSSYLLTGKLGELNEDQRTALEAMHRQSTRLKAIISDFLDISRIESGNIEMGREHIAVEDIAARVIGELKPSWADKGITVTVSNLEAPHLAVGDDQRIAQVFINLLGNAIKFTEEGSVRVEVSARDREVVVEVTDTGMGIPEDELPRVFDRFYQVEKVVTRKTGGTGLGLAIVKNIVEAHGGRITVTSAVGKGTTFRFTLQAAVKRARSTPR